MEKTKMCFIFSTTGRNNSWETRFVEPWGARILPLAPLTWLRGAFQRFTVLDGVDSAPSRDPDDWKWAGHEHYNWREHEAMVTKRSGKSRRLPRAKALLRSRGQPSHAAGHPS